MSYIDQFPSFSNINLLNQLGNSQGFNDEVVHLHIIWTAEQRKKLDLRMNNEKGHRGVHLLIECWGGESIANLGVREIKEILHKSAEVAGMQVVGEGFHPFNPAGVTGFLLLAESHMSIHTWPQAQYAAIDIYTCGSKAWPEKGLEVILTSLAPHRWEWWTIDRGYRKVPMAINKVVQSKPPKE